MGGAAPTPRLCPRPAGGYVALGRGPIRADATGPEEEAWAPRVKVPLSSQFPLQSGLPLSPRSPSAHRSPTQPATTHKVEGSFHHFHRPRGERRPEAERRRLGTWRGSEGRETRRLAGGSSQNPEPAVRAQERRPRHFRLRRRAAGRSLRHRVRRRDATRRRGVGGAAGVRGQGWTGLGAGHQLSDRSPMSP